MGVSAKAACTEPGSVTKMKFFSEKVSEFEFYSLTLVFLSKEIIQKISCQFIKNLSESPSGGFFFVLLPVGFNSPYFL